ncbi:MAG: bifunctional adenosylcobinamide kinase/adenosylcobinamide-phosphate guanylyltransferase, partial [Deltaproteobacteria bacterium]|nr:bifunctional adenosylcobinamide kinase/adenosylcobinamide-phosphate guanylyltransferase [Deltaproteobacteria bacterium]
MKAKNAKIVFVLGGTRSGKSRYALSLAEPYETKAFIATALAIDDEMQQRIKAHQQERGETFHTIEEPYDLRAAIQILPPGTNVAV